MDCARLAVPLKGVRRGKSDVYMIAWQRTDLRALCLRVASSPRLHSPQCRHYNARRIQTLHRHIGDVGIDVGAEPDRQPRKDQLCRVCGRAIVRAAARTPFD